MTEYPPPGNYPPPPPGNYPPPPPPGSGGYGGAPANQPDSNLVWGILVTVLCCLPLGIVSIVKASQVSGLWGQGRYEEAQKASADAKKYAIWGAIAGVVVGVVYLVVTFAVGTNSYS
jgi:Interferon-induced transmembrane protein